MSAEGKRRKAADRRLFKRQIKRTIRALPEQRPDENTLVVVEMALRSSAAGPAPMPAALWRLFQRRTAGDAPRPSQNLDSSDPRHTCLETPEL